MTFREDEGSIFSVLVYLGIQVAEFPPPSPPHRPYNSYDITDNMIMLIFHEGISIRTQQGNTIQVNVFGMASTYIRFTVSKYATILFFFKYEADCRLRYVHEGF